MSGIPPVINDIAVLIALMQFFGIASIFAIFVFIRRKYNDITSASLWKVNKNSWVIVSPLYRVNSESMARVEDVIAVEYIKKFLGQKGIPYEEMSDCGRAPINKNIILICGPKSNALSFELSNSLSLTMQIKQKNDGVFFIEDTLTGAHILSPLDSEGSKNKIRSDIAIIARLRVPGTESIRIICWGVHGIGTIAAAKSIVEGNVLKSIKKVVSKRLDFIAVVSGKFDETNNVVQDPVLLSEIRVTPHVYEVIR